MESDPGGAAPKRGAGKAPKPRKFTAKANRVAQGQKITPLDKIPVKLLTELAEQIKMPRVKEVSFYGPARAAPRVVGSCTGASSSSIRLGGVSPVNFSHPVPGHGLPGPSRSAIRVAITNSCAVLAVSEYVGKGTAPIYVFVFAAVTVLFISPSFTMLYVFDAFVRPLAWREAGYITLSMIAKTALHLYKI